MAKTDMEKEIFIINNFVYHQIEKNNLIIQNTRGIVRVYDPKMITLLKEWDSATNKEVDRDHSKRARSEEIFLQDTS